MSRQGMAACATVAALMTAPAVVAAQAPEGWTVPRLADGRPDLQGVRLFFVGGPISLSGGGEAGGNWIRQGVVRSGRGSGGRRYFCRQRPMRDFRWSSRAS